MSYPDLPTARNLLTGVAIGIAIVGIVALVV
jgi:hypothetical protein